MGCFEKNEIEKELQNLADNGWLLEDFDKDKFIKEIANIEFTSPKGNDVFNAFKIGEKNSVIKPEYVNVLIIGQDPYPSIGRNEGRAHGFAFSFSGKAKNPKPADSLKNIFEAIAKYRNNIGLNENNIISKWNTNLETWAKNNQVLLLNTALTYAGKKQKKEHQNIWNPFVKNTITKLLTNGNKKLVVFLWGNDAQNIFLESISSFGINNYDYNLIKKIMFNEKNGTKISREILCLKTGHPTSNHNIVHKYGFSEDAPVQFEICDKFLNKEIWKDFPENN